VIRHALTRSSLTLTAGEPIKSSRAVSRCPSPAMWGSLEGSHNRAITSMAAMTSQGASSRKALCEPVVQSQRLPGEPDVPEALVAFEPDFTVIGRDRIGGSPIAKQSRLLLEDHKPTGEMARGDAAARIESTHVSSGLPTHLGSDVDRPHPLQVGAGLAVFQSPCRGTGTSSP
jgi:hypothetical protein